jgi:hypothetical protein
MRTETSPRRAPSAPRQTVELVAWALMVAGFALTVVGILQVAGLWALGAGFVLIFAASVPLIVESDRREGAFDDELRRLLDDDQR